ncbi:Formyl-CoA:oxalate CoA-transferase [Streptomyces violaceorubidus]
MPDVDSLYFTMLNCNKRSITLNTKTERGKEILTELIRRSDVMVENFGPGAVDRMGFTWDRVKEINPRIVYASIKEYRRRPVHRLQGVRGRRAGHGRIDVHHRFRGRAAAGDGGPDRGLGHGRPRRGGHPRRPLPAGHAPHVASG